MTGNPQSWRQHYTELVDKFTRSQNKWHMTGLLLADMLVLAGADKGLVEWILEASKDDVARMLIEHRAKHGQQVSTIGSFV